MRTVPAGLTVEAPPTLDLALAVEAGDAEIAGGDPAEVDALARLLAGHRAAAVDQAEAERIRAEAAALATAPDDVVLAAAREHQAAQATAAPRTGRAVRTPRKS